MNSVLARLSVPWSETDFIVSTLNQGLWISQGAVPKGGAPLRTILCKNPTFFMALGIALSEKQIPRFVGKVGN